MYYITLNGILDIRTESKFGNTLDLNWFGYSISSCLLVGEHVTANIEFGL